MFAHPGIAGSNRGVGGLNAALSATQYNRIRDQRSRLQAYMGLLGPTGVGTRLNEMKEWLAAAPETWRGS